MWGSEYQTAGQTNRPWQEYIRIGMVVQILETCIGRLCIFIPVKLEQQNSEVSFGINTSGRVLILIKNQNHSRLSLPFRGLS